jgi:cytochrome c1
LGPSLDGFDDVGLIAGQLPNQPDVLAAFIRNAPSVKEGSSMPPMPISETEAADIAAYLYGLDHD